MNTTTDNKHALREYVDSLGLIYTATFQPRPQPRETVEHPQLHWHITLASGNVNATFPYSQGCGHVKGYEKVPVKTPYDRRMKEEAIRQTCETGRVAYHAAYGIVKPSIQPAPDVLDVLYCLVSDASVRHSASYEEWAPEYGYDIDSRKGEEVYRACQKQTIDLLRVLGGGRVGRQALDRLEKLEELFQNY